MIDRRYAAAVALAVVAMSVAVIAQNDLAPADSDESCVTAQQPSQCNSGKRSSSCYWCMNAGCIPQSCGCVPKCQHFERGEHCPRKFCQWSGNSCHNRCPNLQEVEPRILKLPAVLENLTLGSGMINVRVLLPQMDPSRWNAAARFVNPVSRQQSNVVIAMVENPCNFTGQASFWLSYLVQNGMPDVTVTPSQYIYRFGILVKWNEQFVLDGVAYPRNSEALLHFNVIVNRQIVLRSTVCTLDSTLLWAYLEKGIVYVPQDGSNPYIRFELLTVPAECTYRIEESSFNVLSHNGSTTQVTKPTLAGSGACGIQRWHITVSFRNGICTSSPSDSFTLGYTLVGSPGCTTPPCAITSRITGQFSASLGGLENWCAINATASLAGQQTTHLTPTAVNETCCFFLGNTVYIRDRVFSSGPSITRLDFVTVNISGPALINGPVRLFPVSDPAWRWTSFQCPAPVSANEVCHSFLMREDKLRVDRQLSIATTLRASFPIGRRSDAADAQGAQGEQDAQIETAVLIRNSKAANGDVQGATRAAAAVVLPSALVILLAALSSF